MTTTSDADLVLAAREGSLDAFAELVRRHAHLAQRQALRVLGDVGLVQDVVQESLLAAWNGLDAFRGDGDFGTWLHVIGERRALTAAAATRRRNHRDVRARQLHARRLPHRRGRRVLHSRQGS